MKGNVEINTVGEVVCPPGLVDFEIGPADPSYELKLRGVMIYIQAKADQGNERQIVATRRIHGRDYRLIGMFDPNSMTGDGNRQLLANQDVGDVHVIVGFVPRVSEGTLITLGADPATSMSIAAGPIMPPLSAIATEVSNGEEIPTAVYIRDDKGSNLTVDDTFGVKLINGSPTEMPMMVHVCVETVRL